MPAIEDLDPLAAGADAVGIDIPIGLPSTGPREADLLARQFLGARRHSVFLAPARRALEAWTHALATTAAVLLTGAGIASSPMP